MANITATGIFDTALGAGATGFHAQSSRTRYNQNRVKVLSSTGNAQCSTVNDKVIEVTCSYQVCTEGLSATKTLDLDIGKVEDGYLVTQIVVTETAGEYPTVEITGMSWPTGPATVTDWSYNVSEVLAFGCSSSISEADPTSRTRTWSINNVITSKGSDGEVNYAQATDATLEIQEEGIGEVANPPVAAGFDAVEYENSDDNQEFDTYSARMIQDLALT